MGRTGPVMPTIAQTADTEKRCRVQGTGRGILYTSGAGPVTHSFRAPCFGSTFEGESSPRLTA